MNGDHHHFNAASTNAVAGPSKQPLPQPVARTSPRPFSPGGITAGRSSSSSPSHRPGAPPSIALFLPPPAPPPIKLHLANTQDLLARFNLHGAYNRYVRADGQGEGESGASALGASAPGALAPGDKGKGKQVDVQMQGCEDGPGQAVAGDDDEDGHAGKGDKKKKKNYRHLIKGVPGKHSLKSDEYLQNTMRVPPKQRIQITPFDDKTRDNTFYVSPEGLKGWNIHTLVLESAQAKEDRKKRKELKRLSKLQGSAGAQTPAIQAPIPTPAAPKPSGTRTPQRTVSTPRSAVGTGGGGGTPRPGSTVPRPGSAAPRPSSTVPRPGSAVAQNTPATTSTAQPTPVTAQQKPPVPRPGSNVPRPGSTVPRPGSNVNAGGVATPARTPPTVAGGTPAKGVKRAREESGAAVQSGYANGSMNRTGANPVPNGHNQPPPNAAASGRAVVNAKAGNGGIRPRPLKKQRLDGPGQSTQHVQQQPMSQGV